MGFLKGFSGNNLPTQDGWHRIYTAVQLYFDGFAPRVIFPGGGSGKISEGEVYAEAAQWLGIPREAVVIEPNSGDTAAHPVNLLKLKSFVIAKSTPLIIVTSGYHTRRTSLCFKKTGYTNFSMVTRYSARSGGAETVRHKMTSEFKEYKPAKKVYNDVFRRLQRRTGRFLEVMREYAAIFYYKLKGKV